MAGERADERTHGERSGTSVKRRGILAAAAAVVAGLVARQASVPVQASGGFTQTNFTATGSGNPDVGFDASATGLFDTGVSGSGNTAGVQADGGTYGVNANGGTYGIKSYGTSYGVYGYGNLAGSYGVYGDAVAYGVYGNASPGVGVTGKGAAAGVTGYAAAVNRSGVVGFTGPTAPTSPGIYGGVVGISDQMSLPAVHGYHGSGIGVKGTSTSGFPIIGAIGGAGTLNAGVLGAGTAGPGVQGQSSTGHGLVGTTAATDGQHAALIGSVQPGGNAIGVRGSLPAGAGGFAGVFDGPVIVNGAFQVFGAPKSAAVKHPDNTYRLLYCEEAPESWFADYGQGTLVGGKAEITLDPDFAALVHTDTYHVFLTAHAAQHLHVGQRTATGFSVVATVLGGAAGGPPPSEGGGTFSWRVVAKRKDIVGERLAKVAAPPPLKPVQAFMVPETAEGKPPTKKP